MRSIARLKGMVHPKLKTFSLFTHPHAILSLMSFFVLQNPTIFLCGFLVSMGVLKQLHSIHAVYLFLKCPEWIQKGLVKNKLKYNPLFGQ